MGKKPVMKYDTFYNDSMFIKCPQQTSWQRQKLEDGCLGSRRWRDMGEWLRAMESLFRVMKIF